MLAADLGAAKADWTGAPPALVGETPLVQFTPLDAASATYASGDALRPSPLVFKPFYRQWDRKSAVYFKRFDEAGWRAEEAAYVAKAAEDRRTAARTVDVMHLGEMQPERDHALASDRSYPVTYRGRNGRDARSGGYFEFTLKGAQGSLELQVTYWGDERPRDFDILVNGVIIATQHLGDQGRPEFFDVTYPIPAALTSGKPTIKVRFVPHEGSTVGPVYTVTLLRR